MNLKPLAKKALRLFIKAGLQNESTRVQWIEQTLQKVPTGTKLLDAGCGEQQFRRFCSHLIYVSQDFASYDGKGDGKGLQTGEWDQTKVDIVSDITCIPERDGAFEAILCTEVLEHVPDPVMALRELSRLTASRGYLILTAPFCSMTHFSPYHYSSGLNRYWYEWHLGKLGFEILELRANGNYFEYVAQEVLRMPSMAKRTVASSIGAALIQVVSVVLVLPLAWWLGVLSRRGNNSADLLCFGYHVFARKL